MATKVKPVPDGYNRITPYLCVRDASRAIDFYKRAFRATELVRMADPSGKVGHAELSIAGERIMLADEFPEMGSRSPEALGGSPVTIHLYVDDVDAVARQAVAAGARVQRPVEDQFYGDRAGKFEDPFGHMWYIATHKEDITEEEMKRRVAALYG